MIRLIRQAGRTLGALFVLLFAATAFARAGIQANKTFTPNSVTLGGTSTVTVTLQNDSTSSSAAITAFSDDIGTTMSGHATLLSSPAPTTTCSGGTPTAAGGVLTMNNGTIPIAPNSSTLGSCTITFSVKGALVGNGFNTIVAANVVTSLGSPTADVTQTLAVQAANVTASVSSPGSVQMGGTNTVTYIITNPASVPLTNVAFPITSNGASTYTVTNAATTCGGTFGLPAAGVTGTTTFSGLTIPASGTCSVTLTVMAAAAETVNFILPASMVSDDQGATNTVGTSGQAVFVSGKPNITKSFSPTAIAQNGTSTLTITVQNVLTDKPLTQAAFSDILPAGLTLSSTPVANGNGYCGSPVLGGNGTGTLTFSGGTIATNKTCTITATVTTGSTVGSVTNTIPTTGTGSFTSVEANGSAAAATATLSTTGTGGGISITNTATPTSAGINTPMKLTFGFTSLAGGVFSGGTFAFNVPQTIQPMVAVTSGGAYAPTFTNCGSSSPAVAFGGTGGNTTVTGSNLALTAGGTCSVSFYVMFTATTPVSRNDIETLTGSNVTFTGTGGNVSPSSSPSVTLTEVATLSMTNYVASATGPLNQQVTVSGTINDVSGTADTNAVAVFNLTANKVMLAPTPNFTFGGTCPAGLNASNITIAGNREQFTVTIGAINASCTIGYDVINESAVGAGSYTPGNATYSGTLTGGVPQSYTGQNNVSFASTTITVTKAFGPNQIQSGGNSTADITLSAPQAGSLARTQVNGVTFSDALPASMTFSPTPNVTFTAGCQQAGQPAPAGAISGTTITFTNISLLTVGTAQTTCDAKFDVTSSVVGAPLNQLNAGSITSTSGTTNTQVAKASLTVNAGLGIAKTFVSSTLQIGGTDYVRFLVTNSATTAALSGGTLVDVLPSSLVLASTTLGTIQAGDPALCGGSVAGPVGTGTITLGGLAVAGEVGATPAQCVAYVLVKASGSAASGNVTNTIAAGGLNAGGFSNQTTAAGSVTLTPPGAPTLTKTFAPAIVAPSGTSVLTISIANTSTAAAALSAVALTDALPTGVTVAATPAASTTCTSATLTATAGATSVVLAAGTLAANATCTITVSVTGAAAGSFTNTLAAGALTDTQGATNASAATATLTVAAITLSKAFAPTTISAGASSTLTITIPNGTTPLTGVALTDTLPTGVTIAAAPNAATTCPSGSVTATPGGSSVALTGGTLAASATCTITASVTGTTAATYTNTIAAGALQTTQTITNTTSATANLTIGLAGIALTKAFAPATIVAGGTSVLTITIPNTMPGAVMLGNVALTDTLPAGVTIAATPNATTTCPSGSATATGGGSSIALTGGTLAANATCTLRVDVTGTASASYTNTIAANALTTTQGVTNTAPATASLTISPGGITLSKAFAPATITAGGTSLLTITIPNTATGAVALTGVALTDALPTGVTIAATPNATTTCPSGTTTATAGGSSIALAGGTLAVNATCAISVNVTGTVAAAYTNTIAASALTTTQGVTNAAPATANLTISPGGITLSKAFAPAAIVAGGTSLLTITIPNTATGAVALSGIGLTDTLPTGVTIAATPNATTTCPSGTATATAGGSSIALTGGTLAMNTSCTVSVNVTGTTVGSYLNTIATHALTTTQNVSNEAPATANLGISAVPDVTLTKAFSPNAIVAGATSLLTITVSNTAPSSVPLSGLHFTDAYPTGLVNAAIPAGATTCPAGSVTAAAGTATLALSGATLAANASCTVTVNVDAAAGTYSNTVSSIVTTQGATNVAPATAALSVTAASTPTIANAFSPGSIVSGGISALTVTVANNGTNAIALGNLAFTDTLPAGLTIAPTPNGTTTCPSGTVGGAAGGAALSLGGASLAAGATCTVTIDVTSSSVGSHTNTIAANALSDTQNVSNAAPASATLAVTGVSPVTIVNTFSPAAIVAGQSSLLTIALANTGSSAVALTGLSLTDALPAGMTLSTAPAGATTCVAGSVTGAAGATSVSLGGATLAAGASCSITVNVTSATLGAATDTIGVSNFANTQGVPSAGPASATLTVNAAAGVTLAQAFSPSSIVAGTTSVLTLSLTNAASGAVALSGIALGDTLPAGVVLAGVPNASTTCAAGTLVATAGAATFALSTATLGAGATCTITVSVTAAAAGTFANAIAAGALTSSQGATNVATTTTLTVTAVVPSALTLNKAFAPASISSGGGSTLTLTIANGAPGALALTALALTDTLPAGVAVAATPNASTTCGAGTVTSAAGGATLILANGTLAAGATCTLTVNVTSGVVGSHLDTSAIGAVSDTQNVSNALAASATLSVTAAPALGLTQAFLPAAIAAGATSVLTITFTNSAAGAIPLTALALTDTLPAGVVLATTPSASTTCPAGAVTAVAGAATFALSTATLAPNATCTLVVTVTASGAGSYANSMVAGIVTDAQGVTNAATQATLTVTAQAALGVTKTSDVAGAAVASGQTIAYTVAIVNPGTTLVTGAKLSDVLTNATLVPNSVTVGGAAAPDSVVKTGTPFGSIAAGATASIRYRATVDAGLPSNAQVTNTATASSDQGCAGTTCSGTAPPNAVLSAPKVDVTLLIDGKVSATVTLGQVVLYSATLTNVGGVDAQNVMLTDTLPAGVTPIAGSVTVTNGASASTTSRRHTSASAVATTTAGQSVTVSLGTIAAGASATVEFRATITAPIDTLAANTVTVAATGIPAAVTSNVVVARMVRATLTVTKSASAVVAQIGDRVDYAVRVTAPAGIPFAQTTIVDQLPDYLSYAPGSARINGVASVPAVAGRTLTWTLPSFRTPVTLTYATAIAAGVSANATLDNLVTVSAEPLGGGPPGGGSASAAIQIAASTFGTCYPITGRVYDDVKGSGRFESGDVGLAGVSIVLEDGESVVTDAHGRYNFPCVRQGMHALRLDERTLPEGSVPFPDRAIDSERSIHRLVHGIFDDTIVQDVNFAVTRSAP